MRRLGLCAAAWLCGVGGVVPAVAWADADVSAPTVEAAAALAASSGERVRVDEATGSSFAAYVEPDGRQMVDLGAGPLFVDGAAGWEPVDLDLVFAGGVVRPVAAPAQLSFSDGGDAELAQLADGTGRGIDLDWSGVLPVPTIVGNVATYHDVMPSTDLVVEALADGFSERLVVRAEPSAPIVARFPLQTTGGVVAELSAADALSVETPAGTPVVSADAPLMWDAGSGAARDTEAVAAALVESAQGAVLELRPDPAFLADPSTSYPVVIDPSPNLGLGNDTYAVSGTATFVPTELRTGKSSTGLLREAYIQFLHGRMATETTASDFLRGKHIYSATIKLYQVAAGSTTSTPAQIRRVTGSWTEGTPWSARPGVDATVWAQTSSGSAQNGTVVSFRDNPADASKSLGVLLKGWVDYDEDRALNIAEANRRGWHNYGVAVLPASATDATQAKIFEDQSAPATNPPVMSVHYHDTPPAPTGLSVTGTSTDTPRLTVPYVDADGEVGSIQVQAFASSTCLGQAFLDTTQLGVSSGTTAQIAAHLGYGTIGWRAKALQTVGGIAYSSDWSACQSVTLMISPPTSIELTDGEQTITPTPVLTGLLGSGAGAGSRIEYQVMDRSCATPFATVIGFAGAAGDESQADWSTPLQPGLYALRARHVSAYGDRGAWTPCGEVSFAAEAVDISPAGHSVETTATPTFSVRVPTTLPATESIDFSVVDEAGVEVAGGVASASPGQMATWTVPPGSLVIGRQYSWQACSQLVACTGYRDYVVTSSPVFLAVTGVRQGDQVNLDDELRVGIASSTSLPAATGVTLRLDGVSVGSSADTVRDFQIGMGLAPGAHTVDAVATVNGAQVVSVAVGFNVLSATPLTAEEAQLLGAPVVTKAPTSAATAGGSPSAELLQRTAMPARPAHDPTTAYSNLKWYAEKWACKREPGGATWLGWKECDEIDDVDGTSGYNNKKYLRQCHIACVPGVEESIADCTNFASQTYKNAGWPATSTWYHKKKKVSRRGVWRYEFFTTPNWVRVTSFISFAASVHNAALVSRNPANAIPGDFLALDLHPDDGVQRPSHIMLVVKSNGAGAVWLAGHGNNRREYPYARLASTVEYAWVYRPDL